MHSQKVTISIPQSLYEFVEAYQSQHHIKTRSDVISAALQLLQQQQLEAFYSAANEELNNDFDLTIKDGLEDESW
jgi:Arc/MetJ-type ribon-helix-helix transcriptional regulator